MPHMTPTINPGHLPADRLLDITAVAARLGVSVRHVRRLVHERRIPYIKWGHLIRFDPTDIEQWLDDSRRTPHDRNGAQPQRRRLTS